jgi:hypothetical protein
MQATTNFLIKMPLQSATKTRLAPSAIKRRRVLVSNIAVDDRQKLQLPWKARTDDPSRSPSRSFHSTYFLSCFQVWFFISYLLYFCTSSFLPCFLWYGFCNVKSIYTAFPVMHGNSLGRMRVGGGGL